MFQLLGVKQTLVRAIKLKWNVANFAVMTARISGISKTVKTQTMMTLKMRVTLVMKVNMKAVMKNENILNENFCLK